MKANTLSPSAIAELSDILRHGFDPGSDGNRMLVETIRGATSLGHELCCPPYSNATNPLIDMVCGRESKVLEARVGLRDVSERLGDSAASALCFVLARGTEQEKGLSRTVIEELLFLIEHARLGSVAASRLTDVLSTRLRLGSSVAGRESIDQRSAALHALAIHAPAKPTHFDHWKDILAEDLRTPDLIGAAYGILLGVSPLDALEELPEAIRRYKTFGLPLEPLFAAVVSVLADTRRPRMPLIAATLSSLQQDQVQQLVAIARVLQYPRLAEDIDSFVVTHPAHRKQFDQVNDTDSLIRQAIERQTLSRFDAERVREHLNTRHGIEYLYPLASCIEECVGSSWLDTADGQALLRFFFASAASSITQASLHYGDLWRSSHWSRILHVLSTLADQAQHCTILAKFVCYEIPVPDARAYAALHCLRSSELFRERVAPVPVSITEAKDWMDAVGGKVLTAVQDTAHELSPIEIDTLKVWIAEQVLPIASLADGGYLGPYSQVALDSIAQLAMEIDPATSIVLQELVLA